MQSKLPRILLVEKNHMAGSVIALTARHLNLAIVRKASNVHNAQHYLGSEEFAGLITTIEDEATDLKFLYELRNASFNNQPDMPIVVITPACNEESAERLKMLRVSRVLLKPFKVRDVISTIEMVSKPAN